MASLRAGWNIQVRVIKALMIRELVTRFGRENFGFLWMMVEPLLFAGLVGVLWTIIHGPVERGGITTAAFAATGYIPITMFRHVVGNSVDMFIANTNLLYHRQIKIVDFVIVRFFIEMIGGMMAFIFISSLLWLLGLMSVPEYPEYLLGGWFLYCLFTFSLAMVFSPLVIYSSILEKIIPVSTYIMLPFSGLLYMNSWLDPKFSHYLIYSPFVDAMEMIHYGVFGDLVTPIYDPMVPIYASLPLLGLGLVLCRLSRRRIVVE